MYSLIVFNFDLFLFGICYAFVYNSFDVHTIHQTKLNICIYIHTHTLSCSICFCCIYIIGICEYTLRRTHINVTINIIVGSNTTKKKLCPNGRDKMKWKRWIYTVHCSICELCETKTPFAHKYRIQIDLLEEEKKNRWENHWSNEWLPLHPNRNTHRKFSNKTLNCIIAFFYSNYFNEF